MNNFDLTKYLAEGRLNESNPPKAYKIIDISDGDFSDGDDFLKYSWTKSDVKEYGSWENIVIDSLWSTFRLNVSHKIEDMDFPIKSKSNPKDYVDVNWASKNFTIHDGKGGEILDGEFALYY
jgi:hypothetical protein